MERVHCNSKRRHGLPVTYVGDDGNRAEVCCNFDEFHEFSVTHFSDDNLEEAGTNRTCGGQKIPVIQSGVWVTVAPMTLLGNSTLRAPTFTDIPQPMTLVMATISTKFSLPIWMMAPQITATARDFTDCLSLTSVVMATRKKSTATSTNFMENKKMQDIH